MLEPRPKSAALKLCDCPYNIRISCLLNCPVICSFVCADMPRRIYCDVGQRFYDNGLTSSGSG
jgi:hypothetical protein